MPVNSFSSNQGTQSALLTDNTGGASGTLIPVMKVSMDGQGTYTDANLFQGTLLKINTIGTLPGLPSGTVNVGTVNAGTINTGTINTGTINTGTINTGTINLGTVMGNTAAGGTLPNTSNPFVIAGTSAVNGTVFALLTDANGRLQVAQQIGTVNTGTLNAGTINTGTVNTGTINVATVTAGSIIVTAGTVSAGTINTGTINAGTINVGTFRLDSRTTQNIVSFGTQVAFTGAAAATIVGSASVGAGTSLWLQDVSLFNAQSGLGTFILGFGTTQQGTNVLMRAPLGTNAAAGIEKSFAKAVNGGMTNQDLVLSATGAGTVDLTISYFISA